MPASSTSSRTPLRSRVGSDGLSEREREFAKIKRTNPDWPNWRCAEDAGFSGTKQKLGERARVLMKKEAVMMIITAPRAKESEGLDLPDDDTLKKVVRKRFHKIVVSEKSTDSDAIKAGDKLLATIPGGYVPVQIDQRTNLTLEKVLVMMGGAPKDLPQDHPALQGQAEEDEE